MKITIDLNEALAKALNEEADKRQNNLESLIVDLLCQTLDVRVPSVREMLVNAFVNYDIGAGIETYDLGNFSATDRDQAMEVAESKSKIFFEKHYPELKYQNITKQVKVRPVC